MPAIEHPDRRAVLDEMHLRPFLPYPVPYRFHHYAFMLDTTEARSEIEHIAALCASLSLPPPAEGARFHKLDIERWSLRWERHAEFSSYTWSTGEGAADPFTAARPNLNMLLKGWTPLGQLLVSADLALVSYREGTSRPETLFDRASLTVIEAAEGLARVSTDFRADEHGRVRILVEDFGLSPTRAGRLVQRLIELETYRCLALLGLPAARRSDPVVRRIEQSLLTASTEMRNATDQQSSQALLARLTELSTELEMTIATTSFRFGATRAYADLVRGRLDVIREREYDGYISFSRYLRRRFNPAVATCTALENRQKALSDRIAHTVDLLRTRIQLDVEHQNRQLLASMNRRSGMQLRLQQTVEGLSVAAISYYVVGLVGYFAKGLKDGGVLPNSVSPELIVGLSVPVVIAGVWTLLSRAHRAWDTRDDAKLD